MRLVPTLCLPFVALCLATGCGLLGSDDDDGTTQGPRGPLTTPDTPDDSGSSPLDTSTTPSPIDSDTGFVVVGPTAATGSTAATADTGTTTLPVVDCAALPRPPIATRSVPGARGYHGLVFTDDGRLVGSDGSALVAADIKGNTSVLLPGTGSLQQLDKLSDGTLIAASSSDGALLAIDPMTGGSTIIASGLSGGLYGARVAPDDTIFLADQDRILRVDPATGANTVWLEQNNVTPKVLDFNVDFTKMYVGTNYTSGKVWEVLLDASFDPIGPAVELARTPGSWHDGLTVDICGNIYVAEYNNRALYRITPDGNVGTIIDLSGGQNDQYGHGAVFGPGANGWLMDAIYVPQPYNGDTVAEIIVGVPHRSYTGPVVNAP